MLELREGRRCYPETVGVNMALAFVDGLIAFLAFYQEDSETGSQEQHPDINGITKKTSWWLQMIICAFLVLTGQTVGTLLGRSYFDNGGKSKWIATLVQVAGFPVLFPFLWFATTKKGQTETDTKQRLASFPITIGIFLAQVCMLYSIGIQHPRITTLVCASQLGFTVVFTYFLNKQKFTPYIANSLGLLMISSVLLVFQSEPEYTNITSETKYIIGLLCALTASSRYALVLFLTHKGFRMIIKKVTMKAMIDMTIYQNLVATFVVLIGFFGSGDWKKISEEMKEYKLGQVYYVTNLFWTAVCWQAFHVGCIGLMFKFSSLFSSIIGALGLPVTPVLAVIILNEKLTGLKAMAMFLAIWGFVSCMYQYYLDDMKVNEEVGSDD